MVESKQQGARMLHSGRATGQGSRKRWVAFVLSCLLSVSGVLAVSVETAPPAHAAGNCSGIIFWCDDFNAAAIGSLTGSWAGVTNGGSVAEGGGQANFSAPPGLLFPYFQRTAPVFPATGPFTLEVRAAFPSVASNGVSVAAAIVNPPHPTTNDQLYGPLVTQYIHGDTGTGVGAYSLPGNNSTSACAQGPAPSPENAFHTYKWAFDDADSNVTLYIDGQRQGTCATARPTALYLGNPVAQNGTWSSLSVDYVKVDLSGPTTSTVAKSGKVTFERAAMNLKPKPAARIAKTFAAMALSSSVVCAVDNLLPTLATVPFTGLRWITKKALELSFSVVISKLGATDSCVVAYNFSQAANAIGSNQFGQPGVRLRATHIKRAHELDACQYEIWVYEGASQVRYDVTTFTRYGPCLGEKKF